MDRAMTVRQPWADLIMAGEKDVENRSWPVPSTLPRWYRCDECGHRSRSIENCPGGGWVRVPDGPFPFRLGIHASAKPDASDEAQAAWFGVYPDHPDLMATVLLHLGALLGFVTVTGCHHAHECDKVDEDLVTAWPEKRPVTQFCSRWAGPDRYHWTLADPEPLDTPVPMKGGLGLWKIDRAEDPITNIPGN